MVKRIVDLHQPVAEVAAAFGVSVRTACKWLAQISGSRPERHLSYSVRQPVGAYLVIRQPGRSERRANRPLDERDAPS